MIAYVFCLPAVLIILISVTGFAYGGGSYGGNYGGSYGGGGGGNSGGTDWWGDS